MYAICFCVVTANRNSKSKIKNESLMLQSEGRILFTRFLSATLPKSSFGPRASQSRHQHKKSHLLGFVSIQYRWCGLLAKECAESITALVTDLDFELRLAEHFKPNHLNGPQLGPSADADAARTGNWALQLGDGGWMGYSRQETFAAASLI